MSEGIPSSTVCRGKPHPTTASSEPQQANGQREADSTPPASQQLANGGGVERSGETAGDASGEDSEPPDDE